MAQFNSFYEPFGPQVSEYKDIINKLDKETLSLESFQELDPDPILSRNILNHYQSHREEKKFKCPACPLFFSRKDILEIHVNKAARNKEYHGCVKHCEFCNKDILFSSMKAWREHIWGNSCKTKAARQPWT